MLEVAIGSKIKNAKRLTQIIQVFAKNGFLGVLEKSGLDRLVIGEPKDQIEKWSESSKYEQPQDISILSQKLRMTFEELGPVFVKLGQLLAVRDDILPHSVVGELKKLHHSVMPLPYKTVDQIIKEDLGTTLRQQISKIDRTPLAAGSIGQVHKAQLKSQQDVVIKVRRPGIEQLIKQDVSLLKLLARRMGGYFEKHFKIDILAIVDTLGSSLESELDFTKEAANTAAVSRNFDQWEDLIIPKVFWELCSRRILVIEYLVGVSPTSKAKISSDILAKGVRMFMKMILVDGEFHGDLHPGNLLVIEDSKIGVIDFGLTYRLIDSQRMILAGVFKNILKQDYVTLGRRLSELGEPKDSFDIERFQLALTNEIAPLFASPKEYTDGSDVMVALIRLSAENDLYLPAYVVLIFKTLMSLEGIARVSAANFNLIKVCEEMTEELKDELEVFYSYQKQIASTMEDAAFLAKVAPHQIRKILRSISRGDLSVQFESDALRKATEALSRGASIVSVSLVFSAMLVASTVLLSSTGKLSALGSAGFVISALLALYLIVKLLRGNL